MESLPWSEYGLSGLVIAALFSVIFFMLKWHRQEMRFMLEQASIERKGWVDFQAVQSKASQEIQREHNIVIRDLTVAFREHDVRCGHVDN